jgi:hypothetical protein
MIAKEIYNIKRMPRISDTAPELPDVRFSAVSLSRRENGNLIIDLWCAFREERGIHFVIL